MWQAMGPTVLISAHAALDGPPRLEAEGPSVLELWEVKAEKGIGAHLRDTPCQNENQLRKMKDPAQGDALFRQTHNQQFQFFFF